MKQQRSILLARVLSNCLFATGWSAITYAGFQVSHPIGFVLIGLPFVAVSLLIQKLIAGVKTK